MTVEHATTPEHESPKALFLYSDVLRTRPSLPPALPFQSLNNTQSGIAAAVPPQHVLHQHNSPRYQTTQELDAVFDAAMARAEAQQQSSIPPDASTALAIYTPVASCTIVGH